MQPLYRFLRLSPARLPVFGASNRCVTLGPVCNARQPEKPPVNIISIVIGIVRSRLRLPVHGRRSQRPSFPLRFLSFPSPWPARFRPGAP